jgi:hypothetical protein
MSSIGYYRLKILADSAKDVSMYINNVEFKKYIVPIESCEPKILKYLDSNGQYRFYPFNNYYSTRDNPSLIGQSNKLITSILTDQTNKQAIGYRNERKMQLTADVSKDELEKLSDIYVSPRVYLYVGSNNSDQLKDWIEVTVEASDAIIRRPKGDYGRIDLTVTLPEYFTIKMI